MNSVDNNGSIDRASSLRIANQAKSTIRKQKRSARRSLSLFTQKKHEIKIAKQLAKLETFKQARHVAVYLANDGEVSLSACVALAIRQGKRCYLPRVHGKTMQFHQYKPMCAMQDNKYGIPEPRANSLKIAANKLDLVCLPLVSYDQRGRRLGMGGGYYDRCFAFKRRGMLRSPNLIGIAHSIQRHPNLPKQSWDIPVECIVNERCTLRTLRHHCL